MKNIQIYKNHAYKIHQNEFAQSPNDWDDCDLFLVFEHSEFSVNRKGFYPKYIYENPEQYTDFYIFPVYAYIHSVVSLSLSNNTYPFNDRWDVSSTGFILVSKELRSDITENIALEYAEKLIDEWNLYLAGDVYDVYLYNIKECTHCGNIEYEEIETTCEVYGYDNAVELAKEFINTLK